MQICVFEDRYYRNFLPLTYLRPIYELRCGAVTLLEKILLSFPKANIILLSRVDLRDYVSEEYPQHTLKHLNDEDTWFINGRVLADDGIKQLIIKQSKNQKVYIQGNEIIAAFIHRENVRTVIDQISQTSFDEGMIKDIASESCSLRIGRYPWDLIQQNSIEIENDFQRLLKNRKKKMFSGKLYRGAQIINKRNVLMGKGTLIKSGAVLDAENGPIIIGNNVTIMPNAVIEGPAVIGDNSLIKVGAKIYHGTTIGPHCKVGGEVEASIIHSYSNKQHDGFLGHSYLGSWVNIGADTNTSDLKNTYGNVKVYINGELLDTGLQFVGLTMGDHSKTGINVMFDTGSFVGVSCNVYGAGFPPKFLPSFSWGEKESWLTYQLEKSIETARRVMARRNVQMNEHYEKIFRNVFTATDAERRNAKIS